MQKFPLIKDEIINKIVDDPFDKERDFFVKMCLQHVPYLRDVETN